MNLVKDKRALRRHVRARLARLPEDAFLGAGCAVAAALAPRLATLPLRSTVACFASRPREIATGPVMHALRGLGLRAALPRIDGDDLVFHLVDAHDDGALVVDAFGIPTPAPGAPRVALRECALVLVPGLAFDDDGGRLGSGRGFYDRAIGREDVIDRAVGVFLDEQRVPTVPMGPLDVRLRWLCTPALGLVDVDKRRSGR